MAWTGVDARDQLRRLISDGPTDRRAFQKKIFGAVDGANSAYKAFETRLVSGTVVVYVDGVSVAVAEDDLIAGEFSILPAPIAGATVRASYYWQYFLDAELDQFIEYGALKCGLSIPVSDTIVTIVTDSLRPPVVHYAASDAFEKMAIRTTLSNLEQYALEDIRVADTENLKAHYMAMAIKMRDEARQMRDDVYLSFGQREKAAAAISSQSNPVYEPLR